MIKLNGHVVTPTIFPDGTSQVWKIGEHISPVTNHVEWWFESEAELIYLQQLIMLIKGGGFSVMTEYDYSPIRNELHIPYMPYARQDKRVNDVETFALRSIGNILTNQHWEKITAFDIHSKVAESYVWNLENIEPDLSFTSDYDYVIFPDAGAKTRYEHLVTSEIICGDKVRDQETGYITSYQIDAEKVAGKRVIVVDDLCDGGMTFEILGKELVEAKEKVLYVSHGLFSKGLKRLNKIYDNIITTDTICTKQNKAWAGWIDSKLTVIKHNRAKETA